MKPFNLPSAFFRPLNENEYEPSEATIGPWSPDLQHGGPPAALLTHALNTHPSSIERRLTRITIEILKPVPLQRCKLLVETVRSGRLVELIRGHYLCGNQTVLMAHAWRFEARHGVTISRPEDAFQLPRLPGPQKATGFPGVDYFPYLESIEWRFSEGGFKRPGPATVWAKPRIPLIEGRETTGLEALVLMIDSANGISAELDIRHWQFVPVDMTIGFYRLPVGPWVGMSARTIIGDEGIGQTTTIPFDSHGYVGRSIHTLFVGPR